MLIATVVGLIAIFAIAIFFVILSIMLGGESSYDRMTRQMKESDDLNRRVREDLNALVSEAESLSISEREARIRDLEESYLKSGGSISYLADPLFIAAAKLGIESVAEEKLSEISFPSTLDEVVSSLNVEFIQKAGIYAADSKNFLGENALRSITEQDPDWVLDYIERVDTTNSEGFRQFAKAVFLVGTPTAQDKIKKLASSTLKLNDDLLKDIKQRDSVNGLYIDAAALLKDALRNLSTVEWNEESPLITGVLLAQCANNVLSFSSNKLDEFVKHVANYVMNDHEFGIGIYDIREFFDSDVLTPSEPVYGSFLSFLLSWGRENFSNALSILTSAPDDEVGRRIEQEFIPVAMTFSDTSTPDQLTKLYRCSRERGNASKTLFMTHLEQIKQSQPDITQLGLYSFLACELNNDTAFEVGTGILDGLIEEGKIKLAGIRVTGIVASEHGEPVSIATSSENDEEGDVSDGESRHADYQSGSRIVRSEFHIDAPLIGADGDPIDTSQDHVDLVDVISELDKDYLVNLFEYPCDPWSESQSTTDDVAVETLDYKEYVIRGHDGQRFDPDDERVSDVEVMAGFNPITGEGVSAEPEELYWGPAKPDAPLGLRVTWTEQDASATYLFEFEFDRIGVLKNLLQKSEVHV